MVFAAWQRPGEKTEKQIHCKGPGDCHKPEMKWPLLGRTRKKGEIRDNPANQTLKPRLPPWPRFLRACKRSLGHCFPPDSLKHQGKPARGVKCSAWVAVCGLTCQRGFKHGAQRQWYAGAVAGGKKPRSTRF